MAVTSVHNILRMSDPGTKATDTKNTSQGYLGFIIFFTFCAFFLKKLLIIN